MINLVLVLEVEDVNTHPHVIKVDIAASLCLLFRIAVGVVDKMLGFVSTWNRERSLDENL
jgi:hypothetical protein